MNLDAFASSPVGRLVRTSGSDPRYGAGYETSAFVPNRLPPDVELRPTSISRGGRRYRSRGSTRPSLRTAAQSRTARPASYPPRGRQHVRVTEARFVPPSPGDQLRADVYAWSDWINASDHIPIVVKVALGHYQFETLHPFNDGNGGLGRLVWVLQLARIGELRVPVLNLSPWLESHRAKYQDHLLRTSMTGNFNPWIEFLSGAMRTQALKAVAPGAV